MSRSDDLFDASLDDLARQVYREIKKRFAVELERFRRRK